MAKLRRENFAFALLFDDCDNAVWTYPERIADGSHNGLYRLLKRHSDIALFVLPHLDFRQVWLIFVEAVSLEQEFHTHAAIHVVGGRSLLV